MSGCLALWIALVLRALPAVVDAQPAAPPAEDLRRALGLIQYVAADYPEAVNEDGTLLSKDEFDEQGRFLDEAETLLRGMPRVGRAGILGELRALVFACGQQRPPHDVVPRARRLHIHLASVFADVPLAPRQVPSLAAGRILYAQACAICHGDDGRARTSQAQTLRPAPPDFLATEQAGRLSPYQAYNAISFGVPGTGMASFETLEEEERWDLAFYVLALRHPATTSVAASAGGNVPRLTLQDITFATDADLQDKLQGMTASAREAQIASWRWMPPLEIQ